MKTGVDNLTWVYVAIWVRNVLNRVNRPFTTANLCHFFIFGDMRTSQGPGPAVAITCSESPHDKTPTVAMAVRGIRKCAVGDLIRSAGFHVEGNEWSAFCRRQIATPNPRRVRTSKSADRLSWTVRVGVSHTARFRAVDVPALGIPTRRAAPALWGLPSLGCLVSAACMERWKVTRDSP